MKIALSSDHRGYPAIKTLLDKLRREGHDAELLGDCHGQACDYPEKAFLVGKAVAEGKARFGVLICGTGIGMSIAANKVKGVRAAVVQDELTAELARTHNDANVVCMSADLLGQRLIEKIAEAFIKSEFEGGRHMRRIRKIVAIEQGQDPAGVVE
jgi:ribose 5-phosphate isomerase B